MKKDRSDFVKNLSALLARYFFDMHRVLYNIIQLLSPGAPAYFIIGNNHKNAGNGRIEIETDRLLGLLGQSVGLILRTSYSYGNAGFSGYI